MNEVIGVSVVLYKTNRKDIDKLLGSLNSAMLKIKLFIIDNSPTNSLEKYFDNKAVYIKNSNTGYGSAHNIAIKLTIEEKFKYHLIINPDIYFEENSLEKLYKYMEDNKDIGHVMPKIIGSDREIQYLCKLLPTPLDLFGRRFLSKKITEKRNKIFEMRFTNYNEIMEVPYLSGCFMFLRTEALKQIGGFDERFFMYPEDIDLTRRMNEHWKTIFYPNVEVVHNHAKESYTSKKMLVIHIINIIKYFNKWGWFFDKNRKNINSGILHDWGIK